MIRRWYVVPFLALLLATPAAADDAVGFSTLEIGPGARAQAMGSAFSSVSDDPSASFWNPAGLSRLNGFQVTATHNQSFEGVRQEYLSASKKYSEATVGLSFGASYLSDPLVGTDINGDTTGTFGYYDLVTTAAVGFRASKAFDVGAGVEYLTSKIGDFTGTGFAMNLGVRCFPGPTNLSLGLAVRHLGPGMTLDQQSSALPTTVQGGLSYILPAGKGELLLSGDVAKTRGDGRTHVLLGAEYNQHSFLSVQGGYRSEYDSDAFSFGVGINVSSFQINYAMVPYRNDLGSSSRVAVTYLGH